MMRLLFRGLTLLWLLAAAAIGVVNEAEMSRLYFAPGQRRRERLSFALVTLVGAQLLGQAARR